MENSSVKIVNGILKKLDEAGVVHLEFDGYNEEERSEKYQAEYLKLFDEIVINKIFAHFGIDPQNNETAINFFYEDNGGWFVAFYEPEMYAAIQDILNDDYSELKELSDCG